MSHSRERANQVSARVPCLPHPPVVGELVLPSPLPPGLWRAQQIHSEDSGSSGA